MYPHPPRQGTHPPVAARKPRERLRRLAGVTGRGHLRPAGIRRPRLRCRLRGNGTAANRRRRPVSQTPST